MQNKSYQLLNVGENCIFVKFGQEISPVIHKKVKRLSEYLEQNPFPGYIEFVATYTGTAVNYDPWVVKKKLATTASSLFLPPNSDITNDNIAIKSTELIKIRFNILLTS